MKECQLHRDAFEYYYSLQVDRSYAKVAMKFGKALKTVEKWGRAFKWQKKVESREAEARKRASEKALTEKEVDWMQRNLRIVKKGIIDHLQAIQDGRMKPTYKTLIDLIQVESKLRTGYDHAISVRAQLEIKDLTEGELKQRILSTFNELKQFINIQHFDQIKAGIIDAEYKTIEKGKVNEPESVESTGGGDEDNGDSEEAFS